MTAEDDERDFLFIGEARVSDVAPLPLRAFRLGMRVSVRRCGDDGEHAFSPPMSGIVVRMRRCDNRAWVALDRRATDECHPFDADDEDRSTHVLALPEHCSLRRNS